MPNTKRDTSNLVVVDGSNIATEGRSVPSLAQLNEAVLALTAEFPDITVTVVVDATFGHRIAKSEVAEFDEAVAHNELVTPPAGAIGRGDAFVLSIANKVGARIFSNDSFQEFHGVYPWLFDEGRLIGGKPVPHVGWVFVNRVPVKGPVSRKARGAGKDGGATPRTASKLASLPMPIPTSPPPRRQVATVAASAEAEAQAEVGADAQAAAAPAGRGRRRKAAASADGPAAPDTETAPGSAAAATAGSPVNDLLPFLEFVEHHPIGTAVSGQVESYSSHGAYVQVGDVLGYVPLRLMASPPPRSAREVMRMGDTVSLTVANFAPTRRSVDLAVPGVGGVAAASLDEPAPKPVRRGRQAPAAAPVAVDEASASREAAAPRARGRRKAAAAPVLDEVASAPTAPSAPIEPPAPRRRRKADAATAEPAAPAAAPPIPTKRVAAKAATAQRAATKRAPAKRAAATKPPATETPPATEKPLAKKKAPATKVTPDLKKASGAKKAPPESASAAKPAATKPAAKKPAAATKPAATRKTAATKKTAAATPSKRGRAAKAAASD